jgi:AcrR family transcriptional regulator
MRLNDGLKRRLHLGVGQMSRIEDGTRERLLEAAGEVFARKGFLAAGVGEITERAGANRAAVNYHYRTKEDLYVAAVRHGAATCMSRHPLPTWPEGVPAEIRLRDFIRAFLSRFLTDGQPEWPGLLIMRELAQPTGGACEAFVSDFVRPTFSILLGILTDLVPSDVPEMKRHMLGTSIIGQCLHYHFARHVLPLLVGAEESKEYDLERVTDHIHAFTMAAVRGLYGTGKRGGSS